MLNVSGVGMTFQALYNIPHPSSAQAILAQVDDDDDDDTFRRSIQHECQAGRMPPVRAGPARVKNAEPASGPSGPLGRGQRNPPDAQARRSKPSGWAKGKVKIGRSMLVSWFHRVCHTSHATLQKEMGLSVRSVLLCVIELFGTRTDSYDVESAQAGP